MTNFHERFMQDMSFRGYAQATVENYSREVKRFFDRQAVGVSPDDVTEDDIRNYFDHLIHERNYAPATVKTAYSGLRFFLKKL